MPLLHTSRNRKAPWVSAVTTIALVIALTGWLSAPAFASEIDWSKYNQDPQETCRLSEIELFNNSAFAVLECSLDECNRILEQVSDWKRRCIHLDYFNHSGGGHYWNGDKIHILTTESKAKKRLSELATQQQTEMEAVKRRDTFAILPKSCSGDLMSLTGYLNCEGPSCTEGLEGVRKWKDKCMGQGLRPPWRTLVSLHLLRGIFAARADENFDGSEKLDQNPYLYFKRDDWSYSEPDTRQPDRLEVAMGTFKRKDPERLISGPAPDIFDGSIPNLLRVVDGLSTDCPESGCKVRGAVVSVCGKKVHTIESMVKEMVACNEGELKVAVATIGPGHFSGVELTLKPVTIRFTDGGHRLKESFDREKFSVFGEGAARFKNDIAEANKKYDAGEIDAAMMMVGMALTTKPAAMDKNERVSCVDTIDRIVTSAIEKHVKELSQLDRDPIKWVECYDRFQKAPFGTQKWRMLAPPEALEALSSVAPRTATKFKQAIEGESGKYEGMKKKADAKLKIRLTQLHQPLFTKCASLTNKTMGLAKQFDACRPKGCSAQTVGQVQDSVEKTNQQLDETKGKIWDALKGTGLSDDDIETLKSNGKRAGCLGL